MTDRGDSALIQEAHKLTIGPSSLTWDQTEKKLVIEIDEISSLPFISKLKGTITLKPTGITDVELPLTKEGTHVWRPFAPTAEIDVDLNKSNAKLENENFVKKAPREILKQEKKRLNTFSQHKDKLIQQLKKLQS